MDSIDQNAGNARDVADVLARSPFAGELGSAPVLVLARDPVRIAFANQAALTLFRANGLAPLNAMVDAGASPGARRLRQLASALAAGASPKLEILRFFVGRLPLPIALLCATIADASGELFLVVAPPTAAQRTAAPPTPDDEPAPALSASEKLREIVAGQRFLWGLNGQLCFDAPAPAFAHAVGAGAPRPGEAFDAVKARLGLDESGEFAKALAGRATFAALRLAWPRDPLEEAAIVSLSGAPVFDRERRFLGYRGFGTFTGETAPAIASAPAHEETVATAQAAPGETSPNLPDLEASSPATAERSAEILPLRTPAPAYVGAPNVIPIRPGALSAFTPPPDPPAPRGESIELTTHERDAFREIARALGAKVKEPRETPPEQPVEKVEPPAALSANPTRDLLDLGPGEPASVNPAPGGDVVARQASDLLDRLPIGAMVVRGGEALYLNRTLLDLLGYRDLTQFRADSGLTRAFEGRPSEPNGPFGEGGELSLKSVHGETISAEGRVQTILWDGAAATLISLRRSVEAELAPRLRSLELAARARQAEARELAALLDTATDGIFTLDANGKILTLNRSGEALFGLDQKDVAGESFLSLLAPESREAVQTYFDGLRSSGLASLLNDGREALGRERQGRNIPLFITLGRINSSPDAKFCAVLRDMTQWKTIERDLEDARRQAEKANALKSEFLAKVSHEIRTPLNAILGFAEVIIDERFGPVGNERYKEYLKDIHASGSHLMSLINDLLDLSKIEAGKLDLNFAAIDANRIVKECVSLMQPQAANERIIVRLSLYDGLPAIVADERSLRQIMLNLMSNAVKFNEPGGQVIVSTALNDSGQAVIRVRDTGVGMSDAEIGTALEPFRQISTSSHKGGTGLGLPLTKALVEANRAGFSIKSRKEQGTLVEVAFPAAQPAAAQ
jgi:PAS domain S-box-containing protein